MTADLLPLLPQARSSMGCHLLTPAVEMAAMATGNLPLAPHPGPRGWTCFPRIATRTPAADAQSVHAARDFTIATLRRWGVAERRHDIATVTSELLTNALRHALPASAGTRPRRPIRLALLQPGPCVLCAVTDPSPRAPMLKEPTDLAETGRGLHVIAALSDTWGHTIPSGTGKVVWAMFSTTPGPPHPNPDPRPGGPVHGRGHGGQLVNAVRAVAELVRDIDSAVNPDFSPGLMAGAEHRLGLSDGQNFSFRV